MVKCDVEVVCEIPRSCVGQTNHRWNDCASEHHLSIKNDGMVSLAAHCTACRCDARFPQIKIPGHQKNTCALEILEAFFINTKSDSCVSEALASLYCAKGSYLMNMGHCHVMFLRTFAKLRFVSLLNRCSIVHNTVDNWCSICWLFFLGAVLFYISALFSAKNQPNSPTSSPVNESACGTAKTCSHATLDHAVSFPRWLMSPTRSSEPIQQRHRQL